MLVTTPFALALAWALARGRFLGKAALEALVNMPLVLPPVVIGYALLITFGRQGPLGRWLYDTLGLQFVFTFRGAVLAASVMALPLVVRSMRQALEAVDAGLEAAARTLGATITFVSNVPGETQTLPLAIYSALQQPGGDTAAARLVVWSALLAFAALALAQWCHRRIQRWLGQIP